MLGEKTVPEGVPDRSKRISLRKRKPNSKYSEDYIVDDDILKAIHDNGGVTEEASNVAEQIQRTSSRKRKPNPKHCEDKGTTQSGLIEEDVVGPHVLRKVNGSEEIVKTQVSLPKQKAECKDVGDGGKAQMEEDIVCVHVSEIKGYDGAAESASQVPDENKCILSRKRKPNSNYIEEKNKAHTWLSKEDIVDTHVAKDSEGVSKRSIGTKTSGVEGAKVSDQVNSITESNIESETIERETNGAGHKDEKTNEEYTPTAVILFFVDSDSIPSKPDLHYVFNAYGPLIKAHTEVVKKLCRARVVFKRRSDAKNALKSTGEFSIFGPSLSRYRLSYFYQ